MTFNKFLLMALIAVGLAFISMVLFRSTPRVSSQWIAYMYSSKHTEISPIDLPRDFLDELACRSEAENRLREQFKLENTPEGPIYADAYMCGKACHTDIFTINNSVAEIECEKSYMSLFHGN